MSGNTVTVAKLKRLADEMNKVMGLEPKIKTVAVKEAVLKTAIIENAIGADAEGVVNPDDGIQEGDTFSQEAWVTLAAILDPDDEDQANMHTIASAKAEELPKEEKPAKPAKPAKAEKPAKPVKEEKPKKATRSMVFRDIISEGPKTMDELNAEMFAVYGGSEKEAAFQNYNFCRILVDMGFLVKNEDGKYALVK